MKKAYLPYYHQPTPQAEEFSLGSGPPTIVSNLAPTLGMSKVCHIKFHMQNAVSVNSIDHNTRMHN